jgi:hypothetical protein
MRLSLDGLIHLTVEELLSTPMKHLISGVDLDEMDFLKSCGMMTTISGFTEWASTESSSISIGWDWYVQTTIFGHRLTRVGLPRSNLILTKNAGEDTSWDKNLEILGTVVDALPWREMIPNAISERYC